MLVGRSITAAPRIAYCDSVELLGDEALAAVAHLGFDHVLVVRGKHSLDSAHAPPQGWIAQARALGLGVFCDAPEPQQGESGAQQWAELMACWSESGITGLRCIDADGFCPTQWVSGLQRLRARTSTLFIIAATPGRALLPWLRDTHGLVDAAYSSLAWWDQRAAWLIEEYQQLHNSFAVIDTISIPRGRAALDPRMLFNQRVLLQRLCLSAYVGHGMLVDVHSILALNRPLSTWPSPAGSSGRDRHLMLLTGPLAPCSLFFCRPQAPAVLALCHQPHLDATRLLDLARARLPDHCVLEERVFFTPDRAEMAGGVDLHGAVAVLPVHAANTTVVPQRWAQATWSPSDEERGPSNASLRRAKQANRIVVENVHPTIEGGRFAVKAILGSELSVCARVFADGHARLCVRLYWRSAYDKEWQIQKMRPLDNDQWEATFVPRRLGRHYFFVQGDFEGEAVEHDAQPARQYSVQIDRASAAFASWYELFPRSAGRPGVHGRFVDVLERLPAIRDMGFDVVYFPPIHPIGWSHRKGRNNQLHAEQGDPGSPYAIGTTNGGHTALHPELGDLADFRRLLARAQRYGLAIAMDFAIQCSRDHPWLSAHPEWFRWRADGTIQYAENPPKRYEDIVNPDFYSAGATSAQQDALWRRLRDIVLFWIDEGIKIFRVDNPHTKPLPFWEWMIADIQQRHPDVLFLSEAFTRPAMMMRLAKLGFTQSYTYFTWRNTRAELQEYLEELSASAQSQYFRPHFFVNTPDINPYFLQSSGRAGFLIRAALAATTSGLWGMYSGFELCEAQALPGREEYADSEKYELRHRDWSQPGNIVAELTRLNTLRRTNPALQTHERICFHEVDDERVLFFSKTTAQQDNIVLVAISLEPHATVHARLRLPDCLWGLAREHGLHLRSLWQDHEDIIQQAELAVVLHPEQPFVLWSVWP